MVGDSSNLVDLIRSYLPGDFAGKISAFLGESREKTQSGIDAAVPSILTSLTNTASTTDGAQRLSNAVNGADNSMLSKVSEMFGKTSSSEAGEGILGSLLGAGGFSELAGNLARSSGLSGKGATSLLGFLAPIVFGALKSITSAKGLDASGLSNLLSSQRANFAAAMPGAGPKAATAEPASYVREPLRDVSDRTTRPEPLRSTASSGRWVAPLLIVLGLIGLLWYWGSRPSAQAGREQSMSQQTEVSLDMLQTKYRSVIEQARAQGVEITSMVQKDGKLMISGTAPSMEAANKVWDQIKNVNPSMNDILVNLQVSGSPSR